MKRRAFTLIELIVIVGLLGALYGLAYNTYIVKIENKKQELLIKTELINLDMQIANNINEGYAFLPKTWEESKGSSKINKRTSYRKISTVGSVYVYRYSSRVCSNGKFKYNIRIRKDGKTIGTLDSCTSTPKISF